MIHDKPQNYYEMIRYDLLALLPKDVVLDQVLDVGCGAGVTGEVLKKEYGAQRVTGLEMDSLIAEKAAQRLDQVIVGDIEHADLPFEIDQFGLLVFGDILEHLVDPWGTLSRLARYLKPSGFVLMSIPNIQHWRTIINLVFGHWDYTNAGMLDRTHLRFFTRKTVVQLVSQAGLQIVNLKRAAGPEAMILNVITFGLFADILTFRYIILASIKQELP